MIQAYKICTNWSYVYNLQYLQYTYTCIFHFLTESYIIMIYEFNRICCHMRLKEIFTESSFVRYSEFFFIYHENFKVRYDSTFLELFKRKGKTFLYFEKTLHYN